MSNSNAQSPSITLIRIPQILEVMPVSKSKFWLMVQKGEFPKPIKMEIVILDDRTGASLLLEKTGNS